MAKFQCNVISYVLQRSVDITVVVPSSTIPEALGGGPVPTHRVEEKYPVLYLLHGWGNNHATWCGYSNIELYAEERNIAVVMVSGENKSYRNVPGGDKYFEFIEKELPEFVVNYFPVSDRPEHSYIAGLSMGGYGSLLHGMSRPENFAAVGAFSAAVKMSQDMDGEEDEKKNLDIYYLTDKALREGRKIPPLYIACGEDDFLYEANRAYKDWLAEKSVEVTWVSLLGYAHEWRFWDKQVEEFLKWIPRTDGYAAKGVRKV